MPSHTRPARDYTSSPRRRNALDPHRTYQTSGRRRKKSHFLSEILPLGKCYLCAIAPPVVLHSLDDPLNPNSLSNVRQQWKEMWIASFRRVVSEATRTPLNEGIPLIHLHCGERNEAMIAPASAQQHFRISSGPSRRPQRKWTLESLRAPLFDRH